MVQALGSPSGLTLHKLSEQHLGRTQLLIHPEQLESVPPFLAPTLHVSPHMLYYSSHKQPGLKLGGRPILPHSHVSAP